MSQKKEQKTAEKSVAGPLRKHRTRTEKIDDLKKQISDLRKAEREERQKARDEKLLAIGKAVYDAVQSEDGQKDKFKCTAGHGCRQPQ